MPDYQQGKIYKITAGDLVYIGSTTEPTLARRLAGHVAKFKHWKNGNGYNLTSFQLIEIGHYEITLIEAFPCQSKDELTSRERFHIEATACVNKFIPCRTGKEYYEANIEAISERQKAYYTANSQAILERQKAYRIANAEAILEQHKAYRIANAEAIRDYQKAYHIANAEAISEQRKAYYLKKKALKMTNNDN